MMHSPEMYVFFGSIHLQVAFPWSTAQVASPLKHLVLSSVLQTFFLLANRHISKPIRISTATQIKIRMPTQIRIMRFRFDRGRLGDCCWAAVAPVFFMALTPFFVPVGAEDFLPNDGGSGGRPAGGSFLAWKC